MGGSGGTSTNTIQKTDPWEPAQPYLKAGLEQGAKLAEQPYPYYQGSRVAPVDDRQVAAVNMTTQRALQGSPVMNAAQAEAQNTIGGAYLSADGGANPYTGQLTGGSNPYAGSNPYMDQNIQRMSNDAIRNYQTGTAAQLDRAAAQANAFGSSGYAEQMGQNQYQLGRGLADISGSMRMQDYGMQQQLAESGLNRNLQAQMGNAQLAEGQLGRGMQYFNNERQRQLQGLMFAPQLAQSDYTDAQMLGAAGDTARNFAQQDLTDYITRWQEQALMPYQQLGLYQSSVLPFSGMGGTTNSSMLNPSTSNPMGGALAGGMLGYAAGPTVASMFASGAGTAAGAAGGTAAGAQAGSMAGPYGALIGAGLGYLLTQ